MTKSCFHSVVATLITFPTASALADPILKYGTLDLHTGGESSGEMHQVTDPRTYFCVTGLGISYQYTGSGLLHASPVLWGALHLRGRTGQDSWGMGWDHRAECPA